MGFADNSRLDQGLEAFTYESLDRDANVIRLLSFDDDPDGDPEVMSCRLKTVNLDDWNQAYKRWNEEPGSDYHVCFLSSKQEAVRESYMVQIWK